VNGESSILFQNRSLTKACPPWIDPAGLRGSSKKEGSGGQRIPIRVSFDGQLGYRVAF